MQGVELKLIEFLRERGVRLPAPGPDLYEMDLRDLIDSLEMIRMITFFEKSFGIEIADDDITPETFETVGSTLAFVQSKVSD